MHVPSVTAFYLAILALIYAMLALRVAGLRRANRALFGDAENASLRTAIRVHANFIEYVPIIALLGVAAGVLVALTRFANTNLPENVAGFTWAQLYLVIGLFAVLVTLALLIVDKAGADVGIGLWAGLLGSVGLLVGAVMLRNDVGAGPARPAGPPQSF